MSMAFPYIYMYLDHSGWKAAISPVKVGSHLLFGKNDECLSLFCCVVRLLHFVPKANYFPKQQKSKREHVETERLRGES